MKVGYKVSTGILKTDNFISVDNYSFFNEVSNVGFRSEKTLKLVKGKSTVGFWRIKRK